MNQLLYLLTPLDGTVGLKKKKGVKYTRFVKKDNFSFCTNTEKDKTQQYGDTLVLL